MKLHPGLVELAEQMEATPDVAHDSHGHAYDVERCPDTDCRGVIIPVGLEGRLQHLFLEHGWRMDGRRFDNANRLLEQLPAEGE